MIHRIQAWLAQPTPRWSAVSVGGLGFAIAVVLTAMAQKPFFYDEPHYLNNVGYLHEHGLGREFLLEYPGYAGPLSAYLQFFLEGVTKLQTPGARLVNVFLWAASFLLLLRFFRLRAPGSAAGFFLPAVPLLWPIGGLALTEMPSLFFVCLALLLQQQALRAKKTLATTSLPLLAGLCFGIAVIGRQTLLPAFLLPLGSILFVRADRRSWSLFFLGSLPPIVSVFLVWGGIYPPMIQGMRILNDGLSGIAPFHGILSYGYAFLVTLIIAPTYLHLPKWLGLVGVALGLSAGYLLDIDSFLPMKSVLSNTLPAGTLGFAGTAFPYLLSVLAVWFVIATAWRALDRQKWRNRVPLALATGALLGVPAMIPHVFSSRYVAISIPLLLVLLCGHCTFNRGTVLRQLLGIFMGATILTTWLYGKDQGYAHIEYSQLHYPHLFPNPAEREWGNDEWRRALVHEEAAAEEVGTPVPE